MRCRSVMTAWIVATSLCASSAAAQPTPRRVLSLIPSVTDVIVALGERDRIVARTDFDDAPPLTGLPSVGGTIDPSVEAILQAQPDLVFVWDEGAAPGLRNRLDRAGLRTHVLTVETLGELRATIRVVGALLDVPERADRLLRSVNAGLDSIRAATRASSRTTVRVFYMVWPRPLITTGAGTYLDSLIVIAGGTNVFAALRNPWPVISWEAVAQVDPDVIVWPRHRRNVDPTTIGQLKHLRAARAGRVYALDGDLISRPGPRVVDAARALALALHQGVVRP
jgi:iron complex transport system substrate-binding protein